MWVFNIDGVDYEYNEKNLHLFRQGMELRLIDDFEELHKIAKELADEPLEFRQKDFIPYSEEDDW